MSTGGMQSLKKSPRDEIEGHSFYCVSREIVRRMPTDNVTISTASILSLSALRAHYLALVALHHPGRYLAL